MEFDEEQVVQAQTLIREFGYVALPIGGTRNAPDLVNMLSTKCPDAEIEYLFAGDDLFIDVKKWPNPTMMVGEWKRLVMANSVAPTSSAPLSPDKFGIVAAPGE